jgi:3-oxoacyl-[acyl-carrier-protein] synthase-3
MATEASKLAIKDAGIDPETIDQIIVAHNFGNVIAGTIQSDAVPSIASRVKNLLGIRNPSCVAYDLLFGCPGWIQGVIHADSFIKSGLAKRCLVIGAETLSRVIDPHDRDSMIFSDGAGACIVENSTDNTSGILASSVQSHCMDEAYYLYLGKSYHPEGDEATRYIKMKGRKVYEYAIKNVPIAMKECIEKAGVDIQEVKKDVREIKTDIQAVDVFKGVSQVEVETLSDKINTIESNVTKMDDKLDQILLQTQKR